MRLILTALVCLTMLAACGGDGGSGPGANQPPYFDVLPAATGADALLLNVVVSDQIEFSARAIDPDIEPVAYLWELVRDTGGGNYVTAPEAGTVTGAQTSAAVWSVADWRADFEGSVRIRCTITDGKSSTSAMARPYAIATPLRAQSLQTDLTLGAADSPYVILEGLTVEAGATLSVEAGVELQVRTLPGIGTGWDKFPILVHGTLETRGVIDDPVVIRGGHSEDPVAGGGTDQFEGVDVQAGGVVSLQYTRVQDAGTGLRIRSTEPSSVEFCNFTQCGTGVQVEAGAGTTLTGLLFRDDSTGLQVNSAAVTLDDCSFRSCSAYGINVDSSTAPAGLVVTGSEFQGNLQAHVRMASLTGEPITATIRGTNFLTQTNDAPVINLFSSCGVYTLDVRGNFWGSPATPADIVKLFDGDRHCGLVLGWTDSDCGGDPEACDWSNTAW